MGRKRYHSPENADLGSPPLIGKQPKQSKLEDFFGSVRDPPSNSSASLGTFTTPTEDDANLSKSIDYSRLSPLSRTIIKGLIDNQTGEASPPSETLLDSVSAGSLSQQSTYISRALKQITNYLESIVMLLKEQASNCLHIPQHHCLPSESLKTQAISPSLQDAPLSPSSGNVSARLILDPQSIALSVQHHSRFPPDWTRPWKVKKYLSSILTLNSSKIDLLKVETLPSSTWQTRVLLHFRSCSVPRRIFSHVSNFRELGIFPLRHFKNLSIVRLHRTATVYPQPFTKPDTIAPIDNLTSKETQLASTSQSDLTIMDSKVAANCDPSYLPSPLPSCGAQRKFLAGASNQDAVHAQATPSEGMDITISKPNSPRVPPKCTVKASSNNSELAQGPDLMDLTPTPGASTNKANGCIYNEALTCSVLSEPCLTGDICIPALPQVASVPTTPLLPDCLTIRAPGGAFTLVDPQAQIDPPLVFDYTKNKEKE